MATLTQACYGIVTGSAPDAFKAQLETALKELAQSYGVATGVACRITVKLIGHETPRTGGKPDWTVKTLCRSGGSAGGKPEGGIDVIGENTDFRDLFEKDKSYFFCNDIPTAVSKGYRNSHFTEEMIEKGAYPYRATIVWPVRAPLSSDDADDGWAVRGFLCLDTPGTGAFDAAIDVAPGAAFAHALYSGLTEYREHAQRSEQQATTPTPDGQAS